MTEGLWDGIVSELRPGDVVLIQFGHNDGGAINDPERARGSLPGLGGETQEIDNLQTSRHEVVHTSDEGARLNAGLVAQGFMVLRSIRTRSCAMPICSGAGAWSTMAGRRASGCRTRTRARGGIDVCRVALSVFLRIWRSSL